jgi:hypothetical protein
MDFDLLLKEAYERILFHFTSMELAGECTEFSKLGKYDQAVVVVVKDWLRLKKQEERNAKATAAEVGEEKAEG